MENFVYCTPTKLIFGKDSVNELPGILGKLGKKILMVYGGGSIKKIGLYDEVKEKLKDFEVFELSGVEPNPKYDPSVLEGIRICKENKIDAVLAIGGGSVIDCSKAVCLGALYDGDVWDIISYKAQADKALPLVDILTLAATGSEYDNCAVISRTETNDKICLMNDAVFPVASILDPRYTFSVSKRQTAAGSADAISHIMEQYFCDGHSLLSDGLCEAGIKSIIVNAKKALENPEDYEARGELMMNCSLACNGILSIGCAYSGWPCHAIEHALSGHKDITHGEGLAIVTPRWMKKILNDKTMERFVSFGTHIFGIDPSLPKSEIAEKTIEKTYEMFESFGMPMHLSEVGIERSDLERIAHHIAVNEGIDHAWAPLSEADVLDILIESL